MLEYSDARRPLGSVIAIRNNPREKLLGIFVIAIPGWIESVTVSYTHLRAHET